MTPADKIRDAANSIGLACNLAHSLIHEHCRDIQHALTASGYATEGSISVTQLESATKELEKYGGRLIWLSKAVEKQRWDLLQAGKHLENVE